ncbi:hypothetical protein PWT90_03093 [Aphanocladium album]|nr:hypothetical protein PWT90_03093 [Aphanocladium album]
MPSKITTSCLEALPGDLLIHIANFLPDISDLSKFVCTNKRNHSILGHNLFRRDVLESGPRCSAALCWALNSKSGKEETRLLVAKKSIKAGVDVNAPLDLKEFATGPSGNCKLTPLAMTTTDDSLALAQLLIDAGDASWNIASLYGSSPWCLLPHVDPNEHDASGLTALFLAVKGQNAEMVALLLAQDNLDPNVVMSRADTDAGLNATMGMIVPGFGTPPTAFVLACRMASLEIIKLLHDDDRVNVDFARGGHNQAVKTAFMSSRAANVDFLLRSRKSQTARLQLFCWACDSGDIRMARRALRWANHHDKERIEQYTDAADMVCTEAGEAIRELVSDVLE